MLRGTTPTVTLTLPEDIDLSGSSSAYMSFGQASDWLFDVELARLTLSGNTATATLTQAETPQLAEGIKTKIQLRWLKGNKAYGTRIVTVPTDAIIKDGVIS